MAFVNALSQHPDAAEATGDVVGRVMEGLDRAPDLAVLFCSPAHTDAVEDIVATVRTLTSPGVLIGATAESVVGGEYEVEEGPALSLWAATLPAVPTPVRVGAVAGRSLKRGELTRVFDVCSRCRQCLDLCASFPTLFDLVDASPTDTSDR
mgnify:CR=1 FL=1